MRLIVSVLMWAAVASLATESADSQERMSAKAVEEAIALGQKRMPNPYILRHSPVPGQETNDVVLGRVYTPFLRVALASHRAAADGRQLSASDIDPLLTEPLLYVAIRRQTIPPSATEVRIFLSRQGNPLWQGGIDPVWTREANSVLRSFEADTELDNLSLVAAFPLEKVTPGLHFLVTKKMSGLSGTFIAHSPITEKQLNDWR